MAEARVRARAKLNLTLEVLARRSDGFHDLRTVFQTIGIADILALEAVRARQTSVTLHSDVEIPGENLITRAAHAVLDVLGVRAQVRCRLHKVIPMGAGLGGGSSDAAAVLRALPRLLQRTVDSERLAEAASALGSDVPFFLLGGTALGLGRGTELYPLPDLPKLPVLVVSPDVHVSTAEAYGGLGRTAAYVARTNHTARLTAALADGSTDWATACVNDFEQSVFRAHPALGRLQRRLQKSGALAARMTGSGSSLFAVFRSPEERDRAALGFAGLRVFSTTLVKRRMLR